MDILLIAVYIIFGMGLLYGGARFLVLGASNLFTLLRISKLVAGLTVVAFATGSPELFVTTLSAIRGVDVISVGNIVGSNIINIFLVLGLAILVRPLERSPYVIRLETPILLFATALLTLFIGWGHIPRWGGALFVLLMIATVTLQVRMHPKVPSTKGPWFFSYGLQTLWIVIGAIGLVLGSELFLRGALKTAALFDIPQSIIAVTLVALGTSLPEIAITLYTSFKNQNEITLGNILGSNIFNIFGVIGVAALIAPLTLPKSGLLFDAWILCFATIALSLLLYFFKTLPRWAGAVFLLFYSLYITALML